MRAGSLRHRVTIQQATETQNAGGEPIPAWGTFASAWAAIEPLSGRELETSRQTYGEVSHRLRVRYHGGVIPKMRVIQGAIDSSGEPVSGSRTYEIQGVLNLEERGKEMHLLCTENV